MKYFSSLLPWKVCHVDCNNVVAREVIFEGDFSEGGFNIFYRKEELGTKN